MALQEDAVRVEQLAFLLRENVGLFMEDRDILQKKTHLPVKDVDLLTSFDLLFEEMTLVLEQELHLLT